MLASVSMILLDENKAKLIEQQPTQSQILANSQSLITGLFFGRTKEFIMYENQRKVSEEQEQIFL